MAQRKFLVGDYVKVAFPDPESPWLTDYVGCGGTVVEVDEQKYGRTSVAVEVTEGNPVRPVSPLLFCPEELRKVGK